MNSVRTKLFSCKPQLRCTEPHIVRPVRNNCTIRWKSREVFITELLRREWVGLLLTPTGALHVYFGDMHLGILNGESATLSATPGCLAQAEKDQTSAQFRVARHSSTIARHKPT